ncbi:ATP-binding protein [Streptosporangium sp. NBC_01810]|uniref:ATP-binding protein n=1 Tax=Streptosporangium sp. NBC_01810 TaxID=2975951 RepID=UPI002DD7E99E|nr:ATP-binding protein [Streptosporangium sp. NBC_01810]WSA25984.1 ATP-binding protein [Streptosporangium sp. NBC_01810]
MRGEQETSRNAAPCFIGQRDFPGTPQSAGAARKWVVDLLAGQASTEVMETLELLVSEVVTNAIVHSDSRKPGGLVTVCAGLVENMIHIEVIDDGSVISVPAMRQADDDSPGGRGLGWVDFLATAWGTHHDEEMGRVVWFQLAYEVPSL